MVYDHDRRDVILHRAEPAFPNGRSHTDRTGMTRSRNARLAGATSASAVEREAQRCFLVFAASGMAVWGPTSAMRALEVDRWEVLPSARSRSTQPTSWESARSQGVALVVKRELTPNVRRAR